jgi:hopanoid biosynthesis associated RND transporter like protein HpnN
MLKSIIERTVEFCARFAWMVIILSVLMTAASSVYIVRNFAITTDITQLISKDLPWRQNEVAFNKAFPQRGAYMLIVLEAPTPELAKAATSVMTRRLAGQSASFHSVHQLGGGEFFERNALLYLSTEEVARTTGQLAGARQLLGVLASDASLRGALNALSFGLRGVQAGQFKLDDLTRPLTLAADTVADVLAGRPASLSWRVLMKGKPAERRELRHFIQVQPVLDFGDLEPGRAATVAIRKAAVDLKLTEDFHSRIRLTGPIAIADEEFSTLKEGAFLNSTVTIAVVLLILWLALKSGRIILAVFLTLIAGLAMTAALGLYMVNALNLISVAFAVLFVGLGVDFGIQFSVRYRAERHRTNNLHNSLKSAGAKVGAPLTLAAAATAAGFLSFLPTDYRGLSELGQIAGVGMIIAFLASVTLLPALLKLLNPPGEPIPLGYKALAPVDRFMERHRIAIIVLTGGIAIVGLPLLLWLRFDFNPLNLRSPNVESVATYLDLKRDPDTSTNSIEILAPSLVAATRIADRLEKLPQVKRTLTLQNFVPDEQARKLALIRNASQALGAAINPGRLSSAPSDEDNVKALNDAADRLKTIAGTTKGKGADAARRLSPLLAELATAAPAVRARTEAAVIVPLKIALNDLRSALRPQNVTLRTLPADLTNDWMTPDGRARVEVAPKGDPNDNEILREFATAVLAVEPTATGSPISTQESGRTVVRAFVHAGFWALFSITILLWITLRRFGDVLLTLVPLILAGVVTLEICVLIGLQLNFANIIALPLLLGVGVAFKIYYIMAWRAGQTNLLQSSLTRAVIFSAATTATAFGSLWLSSHPGTSSMGKLLALSLACTLAAAVLFQPVLMGKPRDAK